MIELLIMLSLIGIFAALVLPSFQPSVHDQLQATARILVSDLDYARSLAVAHNSTYRLTFDIASNRYWLEHAGTNAALNILPERPFRSAGSSANRSVVGLDDLPQLGGHVRLRAVAAMGSGFTRVNELAFGPVGETVDNLDRVIWLSAGTGASRRYVAVRVQGITGLATVESFDAIGPPAHLLTLEQRGRVPGVLRVAAIDWWIAHLAANPSLIVSGQRQRCALGQEVVGRG